MKTKHMMTKKYTYQLHLHSRTSETLTTKKEKYSAPLLVIKPLNLLNVIEKIQQNHMLKRMWRRINEHFSWKKQIFRAIF